ncbi:MAG: DegV family protein [Mycoplasmatales bacterium]
MNKIGLVLCSSISKIEAMSGMHHDVLNLTVTINDRDYTNKELTLEELFNFFENDKILGKTSQPSPAEIEAVLTKQLAENEKVLVIAPTLSLSGTIQNIHNVKNQIDTADRIQIIDSNSIAVSEAICADYAIKMINEKQSIEKIKHFLDEKAKKVVTFVYPNSIKYMHASGRVSATQALIGSFFNIKVGASTYQGKAELSHKGRGFKSVLANVEKHAVEFKSKASTVYYTPFGESKEVYESIMKIFKNHNYKIIETAQADVVVATHFGPGTFAFAFDVE